MLLDKYNSLKSYLKNLESVVVAFSGGIDSSLVSYVASEQLGTSVLAVTSGSASLKRDDLELTQLLAKQWRLPHRVIYTQELNNPDYSANPVNRCYYCKDTLYKELARIAREEKLQHIVNGTNLDDQQDYRPGLIAAEEHQVHSPLVACGFRKTDVRHLANYLGVQNSNKPQSACLSSRVPYGTPISSQLLTQIERAETILSRLGFTQFRVRHHGDIARLELIPDEFELAIQHKETIETRLKSCGYLYVTIDLGGFRSGSLNEKIVNDSGSQQV